MDKDTTIEELKRLVINFRDKREWKKFHNPKDLAISMSIEVAELLELFQWKSNEEIREFLKDNEAHRKVCNELADVIMYSLDMADAVNADISDIVKKKLEQNEKKYPIDKAKGNAMKYSEL